jgi:hypothetical protein
MQQTTFSADTINTFDHQASYGRDVRRLSGPRLFSLLGILFLALIILSLPERAFAQSVGTITLRTDGSCTAANRTLFNIDATFPRATTNDTGDGRDRWGYYLLDGNNTVLGREDILVTIPFANPGARLILGTDRTPAIGDFKVILRNEDNSYDLNLGDTADLNDALVGAVGTFNANALDPDCPGLPDVTAPNLTAVTIASNNADPVWAKAGDLITLSITTDEALAAAPTVIIAGDAATLSGGGTSWTASITVSGATTEGQAAISISNYQDAAGNSGPAITTTTNMSSVTIDRTAPTLSTSTRNTPIEQYTNADSFIFSATFSEPMINLTTADFAETSGEPGNSSATSISATSGTALTVTFSDPKLANMNRSIGMAVNPNQTASDRAGNKVVANQSVYAVATGTRETYIVDNTAPILQWITRIAPTDETTGSDTLYWAIFFDEDVSTFNPAGVTITGTNATLNASLSSVPSDRINARLSGGDLPDLNGPVTIALNAGHGIADRAGNAWVLAAPTGDNENSYTVVNDVIAPTVTSIERKNPSTQVARGGDLTWTVTFSEDVQNVDVSDFALSGTTGVMGDLAMTGGPRIFDVTASGGNLAAILDSEGFETASVILNVSLSNDITDLAGNDLNGTRPTGTNEALYLVDNRAPTINQITRYQVNPTNSDTIRWYVNFSEDIDVATFDAGDVTVTGTNATVAIENTGSSETLVVALSGGDLTDLNGTVTLGIAAGATITDAVGNPMVNFAVSGTNDNTIDVINDADAPQLISITRKTPAQENTNADSLTWTVTFNEALQFVAPSDFVLTNVVASITVTPTADPTVYDVTAFGGTLTSLPAALVSLSISPTNNLRDLFGNAMLVTSATGTIESYNVSNTPPQVDQFRLDGPEITNADTLEWRITFASISPSFSLSPADFTVTGTTATVQSVTRFSIGFDVVVSGGDLANLNGDVTLGFSNTRVTDEFGNIFADKAPLRTGQDTYTLDNSAPSLLSIAPDAGTVSPTDADSLSFLFTYSENLDRTANNTANVLVTGTTATVTITPVSPSVGRVTLTGGDLADLNGTVTVGLNPVNNITDVAGNAIAGIAPTGTNNNSILVQNDITPPAASVSTPPDSVNGPFELTFTFTEGMTGLEASDFLITNGTGTLSGGPEVFILTVTPTGNGDISVELPEDSATDGAGNGNAPFNANIAVTFDTTPPTVEVTDPPATANGPFELNFDFSEEMTGLTAADFEVENATVTLSGGPKNYVLTVTPDGTGDVAVNLPANAATDPAGNGNEAFSSTVQIQFDDVPPTVSLTTVGSEVSGPFTVTINFSEAVTGFDITDITAGNGALSDFSGGGNSYSVLVTPDTIGPVTVSVADGVAIDEAGNVSVGNTLSVTAGGGEAEVFFEVTSTTSNVGDLSSVFNLSNPGTTPIPFIAFSDAPFVDVTPASGEMGSLESIQFQATLNNGINSLPAGTYEANIIVQVGTPASKPNVNGATANSQATSGTVLANVPIMVVVEERFGDFELVVRTPAGPASGSAFQYTSDIAALNGLGVATNSVERRITLTDLVQGQYALEQATPEGFVLTGISCSGDLDNGSVIDLETGKVEIDLDPLESISCVFENTRDEAAIRVATQRAIRNFMARRGDRVLEAAPDLSHRFSDRNQTNGGEFVASGSALQTSMDFRTSLAGFRNKAAQNAVQGGAGGQAKDDTGKTPSPWDIWISAEYASYDDDRADSGVDGKFFAAQFGADYQVKPDLIIGAMVQYDWMDETDKTVAEGVNATAGAQVKGDGLMAGPYLVWKAKDQLTIDLMGLWGSSDNEVNPLGYYTDDFETDRFMIRANATGEFSIGKKWRLRPQVSLSHYEDQQDRYIDQLGIEIPSQTVSIGRLRAGPEFLWMHNTSSGTQIELGGSLRAVWDYNGAGLLDQSGRLSGESGSVRADGGLKVGLNLPNGTHIRAKADLAGIDRGDFSVRSGRLEFVFPFGGKGGDRTEQANKAWRALSTFGQHCGIGPTELAPTSPDLSSCQNELRPNLLDTNIALMSEATP